MPILRHHVTWKQCWRIFSSKRPHRSNLENVASTQSLSGALKLRDSARDTARHQRGEINILRHEDAGLKDVPAPLLTPFADRSRRGSRFSDGTYGVLYMANTLATCVAEVRYHRERFFRTWQRRGQRITLRTISAKLDGELHDIRGLGKELPDVYSPDNYNASQKLGKRLRNEENSLGLVYDSVRDELGQCLAAFSPAPVSHMREEGDMMFEWDGEKITHTFQLKEYP
jgi:hypothetical protein